MADLLQLIRETENDDLTCALQRFVCTYSDEIAPLAVEVTKHLVCYYSDYSGLGVVLNILKFLKVVLKYPEIYPMS